MQHHQQHGDGVTPRDSTESRVGRGISINDLYNAGACGMYNRRLALSEYLGRVVTTDGDEKFSVSTWAAITPNVQDAIWAATEFGSSALVSTLVDEAIQKLHIPYGLDPKDHLEYMDSDRLLYYTLLAVHYYRLKYYASGVLSCIPDADPTLNDWLRTRCIEVLNAS